MTDFGSGRQPDLTPVEMTLPPISRHALALYCGASGDHNPVHVDVDFARGAGFEDVFVHGMLVMAYLGRMLTWLADPSKLRSFSARFVSVTPVHDVLTCTVVLKSMTPVNGVNLTTLELLARGANGEVRVRGEAVIER